MTRSPSVTPMAGPFGARVTDVDTTAELTVDVVAALRTALDEHHVLLIEGQRFDGPAYARFGRMWGEPIEFFNPADRNVELPELIRIRNSPKTAPEMRDGAMHWHQDSTYEDVPAAVTMLQAVEAPPGRNETLFADAAAAHDALPVTLCERIARLRVVHSRAGGAPELEFAGEWRGRSNASAGTGPTVTHPLVIRHPRTDRPALYGVSGTAVGIEGMDRDEAIALLVELKRHAIAEHFVQSARCDVGSILIWDNFAVLHRATATTYSDADGERRLLYRYSTRDAAT